MPDLFIVRGLPSCGKNTFADKICLNVFSADDYFYDEDGNYDWFPEGLGEAHASCKRRTEEHMGYGVDVAVANTFTTMKEMKPYFKLADKYGYTITTVIVESRHGNKNDHAVPDDSINKMRDRFNIQL